MDSMAKKKTSANASSKTAAPSRSGNGIQVIARAADVLRVLADAQGLSLAGIAELVGLPRSTVHRIVVALEKESFVSKNGPAQYRLGAGITHLAEASKLDSIRDMHPYLSQLSRELDETVDLSVRTGDTVTFVDQIVAPRRLRAVSALGRSFPLYCTANGKALLAALPESMREGMLNVTMERFTPKTITTRQQLEAQLTKIARSGFAFDLEEHTTGICAIGSCLHVGANETLAISVPLPTGRLFDQETRIMKAIARCFSEIFANFAHIRPAIGNAVWSEKNTAQQASVRLR
jgi:DNA-binding IclR family transcriptional regulator